VLVIGGGVLVKMITFVCTTGLGLLNAWSQLSFWFVS